MSMNLLLTILTLYMYLLESPIMMIMSLITITLILTSMLITPTLHSPWLAFITFMMMIGGLLILFLYSTTLSPKSQKPLNSHQHSYLIPLTFLPLPILILSKSSPLQINNFTSPIIMPNHPPFMAFSVLYLFSLLFVMTLLIQKKEGPLRSN